MMKSVRSRKKPANQRGTVGFICVLFNINTPYFVKSGHGNVYVIHCVYTVSVILIVP